jgi:release factor glutamine methyltransferase
MTEKFFFNGIELEVPDTVYYPREDSILLAEALSSYNIRGKCLEMGCGSGLSSIVMARAGGDVTAVDVDEEAILAIKKNAEINGVSLDVVKSDLFDEIDKNEKFDLITFNPPYLPEGQEDYMKYLKDIKHQVFGGKTGREIIARFLKEAGFHLNKNGKILLQISTATDIEKTIDMCNEHGFSASVIARKKIPWEELVVIEISN